MSQEKPDLYYFDDIDERNILILPEKTPSRHFPGYTFQSIVCRQCKSRIGYMFSPVEDPFAPIHRFSLRKR